MKVSPFTPGSDQQGSAPNPYDDDYRRKFDEGNFEERLAATPSQDDVTRGLKEAEDAANKAQDKEPRPVREQESDGGHSIPTTFSGKGGKKKLLTVKNLKRASPFIGGGGIIGIVIFLIGGWLPTMLVPGLAQGAIAENDSRSTVLERRLLAKLKTKTTSNGACDVKLAICRNQKMPKVMLDSMAKKGITPLTDGKPMDTKGTGYVDTNPTHYQFIDGNGKTKTIAAGDFLNEYKNNPVFRKTFKKAWNMRYVSYASNFMRKVLGKWGAKPDGGKAADDKFNEKTAPEETTKATKAGNSKLEGETAKTTFKDRVKSLFKRAGNNIKKSGGDPILMVGTGACTIIGMPTFIAGTIRTIQLAQVVLLASDFIISAGDMIRSGDAKPEQTAAVGNTLTGRYLDPDTNKMGAAVDSPILLAAAGAATQSILKPNKYMPGFAAFNDPGIKAMNQLNKDTKQTCNLITSPQAQLASTGVTIAINAIPVAGNAASLIKFLAQAVGKVALTFGLVEGIIAAMDTKLPPPIDQSGFELLGGMAFDAAKAVVGNQYDDIKGIQFGDALGAGIFAALSLGALGGGAAVLNKTQAASFKKVSDSIDNQYRDEDVATLSPFDVSSRYTFLGSIVNNLAISTAGTSGAVNTSLSMLGSIITSPLKLFSNTTSAAVDPIEAKFGYADYYGVESDIGVTVAGTPATGMPTEYLDMDTTTAENLVSNSFDPLTGKPYEPAVGLDATGNNADISTTISSCADADLEAMSGCTIDPENPAKSAAERNYFMDYTLERVLNGEDAADGSSGASSIAGATIDMAALYDDSTSVACAPGTTEIRNDTGYRQGSPVPIKLCSIPGTRQGTYNDGTIPADKLGAPGMANSRVSGAFLAMTTQMRTDLGLSEIPLNDSFRTMAEQQANKSVYGGQAADPGFSNHQMGVAFDMGGGGCSYSRGITSCSSSAIWSWLTANASKYGFKQLPDEWWHWSPDGQ